jgi:parallel beta-helix repeat protein
MRSLRIAALAALSLSLAAIAAADTFTVSNTNDSGAGSLRNAITLANGTAGDDVIHFASDLGVLTPATPYPAFVGKISIDGGGAPTYFGNPGIDIDAAALSAPVLRLTSGSTLRSVAIHGSHGAAVEAGDGSILSNCYIGTNVTGTSAIPNATGILVTGANARLISNLVSGNTVGIEIVSTATGTSIYDNHVGLSASSSSAIPNGTGVVVNGNGTSSGLEIGILGIPNIISGNTGAAIRVTSFNAVTIHGNYIGTADYTGRAMGNGGNGVELAGSSNCTISDNEIKNNGGAAIWIGGGSGAQSGNRISKNIIARNGFGIDLGGTRDGHTANDAGDGDSGPNGLQNHPVLSAVLNYTLPNYTTVITGSLASAPNSTYAIELFVNPNCSSGDYAQAETYLTTLNVTTDAGGNATFSYSAHDILNGNGIAATATDAQNNTSELSNCALVRTHGRFLLQLNPPPSAFETAGNIAVTVTRTDGSAGTATVDYATSPAPSQANANSATAGLDYIPVSGTLTFADGETLKTITIPVLDDKLYELSEIFTLTLSNPTGGSQLDYVFTEPVYIIDDEPQSKLTISDTSVTEGNSGTTYAKFPVTITPAPGFPVTVTFAVSCCESATAGEDYQQISGSITFAPGEGLKTIDVPVFGDTNYERDEVFGVSILTVTPDAIAPQNFGAHATIINDDIGKVRCTPSVSVVEGPGGKTTNAEITCTPDSPFAGGVHYLTANGTANAAEHDYVFSSGSVVFNPGIYFGAQKFSIPIIGDNSIEPDETFTINLEAQPAEGWNFIVEPSVITVTILNDDTPGVVTCGDVIATEGNSGFSNALITCSSPSGITGTIDYATHDGTARAPSDYFSKSGTLTFNDETTKTFTVQVVSDTTVEPDEQFTVSLMAHPSALSQFSLSRNSLVVTISNDDEPPPAQVVASPARLVAMAGENVQVRASMEPPSDSATTLTILSLDPSIASVPATAVIAPHQAVFFPVAAKKRGTTMITINAGSGTSPAVLMIDVTEGSPSLISLEPAMGPATGGAPVLLHGANLSSGCVASFGGLPASGTTLSGPTAATVVSPPHAAGTVDVTLTCGSATVTLPNAFTYVSVRGRASRH